MERISKENYYLDIAETVLERATCLRRVYGAIIVKNDEIISTGYNGAPRGLKNCMDLGYSYRYGTESFLQSYTYRSATGADAVEWAKKVRGFGVETILPTSKAGDGARTGYDLPVIRAIHEACPDAAVVASGGAGKMEHFLEAAQAGAGVLLAASVFHFHLIDIGELKQYLRAHGVTVRS